MTVLSDTSVEVPLVVGPTFPLTLEVVSTSNRTYVDLAAFGVPVYAMAGHNALGISAENAATSSVRAAFGLTEQSQRAQNVKLAPGELWRILEAQELLLAPYRPFAKRLADSHLLSFLILTAIVSAIYLGVCIAVQASEIALLDENASNYSELGHRLDLMGLRFFATGFATACLARIKLRTGPAIADQAIVVGGVMCLFALSLIALILWGGLVNQVIGGFPLRTALGLIVFALGLGRALFLDVFLPARQKRLLAQAQSSAAANS